MVLDGTPGEGVVVRNEKFADFVFCGCRNEVIVVFTGLRRLGLGRGRPSGSMGVVRYRAGACSRQKCCSEMLCEGDR